MFQTRKEVEDEYVNRRVNESGAGYYSLNISVPDTMDSIKKIVCTPENVEFDMITVRPYTIKITYIIQEINVYYESLVRKFSNYVFKLHEPSSSSSSSFSSNFSSSSSSSSYSSSSSSSIQGNSNDNSNKVGPLYEYSFMRVDPYIKYFSSSINYDNSSSPILSRVTMIFILLAIMIQISFFATRSVAEKQSGLTSMMEIVNNNFFYSKHTFSCRHVCTAFFKNNKYNF